MATERSQVKRLITVNELTALMIADSGEMERELMPRLGVQFRKNMRRQFATEGESGGEKWLPLSEVTHFLSGPRAGQTRQSYAAWKRKHYPGRKILVREGHMRESLVSAGHHNHIEEMFDGVAQFGSTDPVAEYHHLGGPNLPVRDPIQQTEEQEAEYTGVIIKWLKPRFRRHLNILKARTSRRKPK